MLAALAASAVLALPRGVIHGRRGVIQGAVAGVSLFRMSTEAQAAPELPKVGGLIQRGTEELMAQKGHGTTANKVQANLRWGCDGETADRVRRRATRRKFGAQPAAHPLSATATTDRSARSTATTPSTAATGRRPTS